MASFSGVLPGRQEDGGFSKHMWYSDLSPLYASANLSLERLIKVLDGNDGIGHGVCLGVRKSDTQNKWPSSHSVRMIFPSSCLYVKGAKDKSEGRQIRVPHIFPQRSWYMCERKE